MHEETEVTRKAVDWVMQKRFVSVNLNSEPPTSCSRIGHLIANYIEDKGAVFIKKRNTEESKGVLI